MINRRSIINNTRITPESKVNWIFILLKGFSTGSACSFLIDSVTIIHPGRQLSYGYGVCCPVAQTVVNPLFAD